MNYLHSLWMPQHDTQEPRPKVVRGYYEYFGNSQSSLCWTLSNLRLRERAGNSVLYACNKSADYLASLNLQYDRVVIIPDELLRRVPTRLWAFPKLYAMADQSEPFVHIDGDVFLAKPLPALPECLVQHEETLDPNAPWLWFYGLHSWLTKLGVRDPIMDTVWEVVHALENRGSTNIYNFGIVGGTHRELPKAAGEIIEFICKYAPQLKQVGPKTFAICVLEQMWIPALLIHKGVKCAPLLREGHIQKDAKELGYCHVLGHHKKNPDVLGKIKTRILELDPTMPVLKHKLDYVANPLPTDRLDKVMPPEGPNSHTNEDGVLSTSPPSLRDMATGIGGSMVSWAKSGFKVVNDEMLEFRQNICGGCEFWDVKAFRGTGRCLKCGCSTKVKLRLATASCPVGKWGVVSG